jgi:hypothetical protein
VWGGLGWGRVMLEPPGSQLFLYRLMLEPDGDNTVVLLFNMLQAGNIPGGPGSLTLIQ